jgi:hypothetical protein
MLRFFTEPKQKKLESWLNYMQKEFEYNQQMLNYLHRLKLLEQKACSPELKHQTLHDHPFSEYYFNQLIQLNAKQLDEVIDKILTKQNHLSRKHHSYCDWHNHAEGLRP